VEKRTSNVCKYYLAI